jgi:arylsulfatase A-like enzyme
VPEGWTETVLERNEAASEGYFPNRSLTGDTLKRITAAYYATISQIDHQVGRMVALLKERGLYDNALIVYTSDHGDYMGHQHMVLKGNHMYDPLVKVPLLIKFPGGPRSGGRNHALVSSLDVTRTIVCAAGVSPADAMRGRNLAEDAGGHAAVFAEGWMGRETMVRTKTRKLLLDADCRPSMLFDLERDPLELADVKDAPAYVADRDALLTLARQWRSPGDIRDTYLNERERVIQQPNVPPADLSHRPEIVAYYARKVAASRQR